MVIIKNITDIFSKYGHFGSGVLPFDDFDILTLEYQKEIWKIDEEINLIQKGKWNAAQSSAVEWLPREKHDGVRNQYLLWKAANKLWVL